MSLYGGLGVAVAVQNALNHVWGVPINKRPDPFRARLRSLLMLVLLGLGVLVTTVLSVLAAGGRAPWGEELGVGLRCWRSSCPSRRCAGCSCSASVR